MKFRSFFWILITGAVTVFLVAVIGLGWLANQSSLKFWVGGVNTLPQSAVFLPKQTPGMVTLLTNPEQLNGWRLVNLPLQQRSRERFLWQQWSQELFAQIGLDYQQTIRPWLGTEITLALTTLDYDRNPQNGAQPGYLLAMASKNFPLAQKCLQDKYSSLDSIAIEQYKGVNLIYPQVVAKKALTEVWSSAVTGDFVLFANHPQILKQAINQAQAVSLNLSHSEDYQAAIANIKQPRIAFGYLDVPAISAWLNKSSTVVTSSNKQILAGSLSFQQTDLLAQTWLTPTELNSDSTVTPSFLNNPEVQQIISSLSFDRHNSAYIELQTGKSFLEEQIPLYKVSKLALKSLFPHLKAIAIHDLGIENNRRWSEILLEIE